MLRKIISTTILSAIVSLALAGWLKNSWANTTACSSPNIIIVLDRSGSMEQNIGGITKWNAAKRAITGIVNAHGQPGSKNPIRFGLLMFPKKEDKKCTFFGLFCSTPPECSAEKIKVDIGDNKANDIINHLNTSSDGTHTPIGAAIHSANNYPPLKDANRRNFVMLITDGQENCGTKNDLISQVVSLKSKGINTYVVGFGDFVDTNTLTQMVQAGGTAKSSGSKFYHANNASEIEIALDTIAQISTKELCDGKDNNCDGQVDEGFDGLGDTCHQGQGICAATGTKVCSADQHSVICDAPKIEPEKEVCDNLDNNCDGQVDENFDGLDDTCQIGDGECTSSGVMACSNDQSKITCDAPKIEPEKEICDNKDNDCDGQTDNGFDLGETCASGIGACAASGQKICSPDHKGTVCNVMGSIPAPEKCNNIDDDCDGQVDEELMKDCSNACNAGQSVCKNGQWSACNAAPVPPEVCNGKDDDCDLAVDEVDSCNGPGAVCLCGSCVMPCFRGECGNGFFCVNNYCVKDPCCGIACPKGKICANGKCLDPCDNMSFICLPSQECRLGKCIDKDCFSPDKDCPVGEVCIPGEKDGEIGTCQQDLCYSVTCQAGEFCRDGQCIKSCTDVNCLKGFKCQDGSCLEDKCANVTCRSHQVCINGECSVDLCMDITCDAGKICHLGKCSDEICRRINCPMGDKCLLGQCADYHPDNNSNSESGGSGGKNNGEEEENNSQGNTGGSTGTDNDNPGDDNENTSPGQSGSESEEHDGQGQIYNGNGIAMTESGCAFNPVATSNNYGQIVSLALLMILFSLMRVILNRKKTHP